MEFLGNRLYSFAMLPRFLLTWIYLACLETKSSLPKPDNVIQIIETIWILDRHGKPSSL